MCCFFLGPAGHQELDYLRIILINSRAHALMSDIEISVYTRETIRDRGRFKI